MEFAAILIFVLGYLCITLEHPLQVNKSTSALFMAVLLWTVVFLFTPEAHDTQTALLQEYFADVSELIFFLLGAITIVEIINAHGGFRMIQMVISTTSKRKLLWIIGFITFFLSSILDNLTTTIVMVTLVKKMIANREDRILFGSTIVVAANAGGAWTPIGDVTTTMLWIGGQITTVGIMKSLFLPSLLCFVVVQTCFTFSLKGEIVRPAGYVEQKAEPQAELIFILGALSLILVPVFKVLTGLPPYMGILLGLSALWITTDLLHRNAQDRDHLRVPTIMTKVDLSAPLFFLGILLAVAALARLGLLVTFAAWLGTYIPSQQIVALFIGLASAVIDNVPLVAASMDMYPASPENFWELLAYCAGTGGSILIIGSAAGVAFMSLEKVSFGWYLKKASLPALLGYLAGFLLFYLTSSL